MKDIKMKVVSVSFEKSFFGKIYIKFLKFFYTRVLKYEYLIVYTNIIGCNRSLRSNWGIEVREDFKLSNNKLGEYL